MVNEKIDGAELLEQFEAKLRALPDICVLERREQAKIEQREAVDAIVHATIAQQAVSFYVEIKRDLFPRDVPQIAWHLQRAMRQEGRGDGTAVPFVLANAISRGARQLLLEEGIGYFDLGGSLSVPVPGAYILIDQPPPRSAKRAFTTIFQGKRAQVLEAVWTKRERWFSVSEVSEMAQVAPATASNVLAEMERRNWVDAKGRGPNKVRQLVEPVQMLDEWEATLAASKRLPVRHYYVPSRDAKELAVQLDRACHRHNLSYAITGEFAAQLHSPFLTSIATVTARLLAGRQQNVLLEELAARPVDDGWNLGIIDAASHGEMAQDQGSFPFSIATPLRIWLDLLQMPGRARELAEHFRKEHLQS
jgi:DNA-binding transcriptional regulator YhcF (GntR family)